MQWEAQIEGPAVIQQRDAKESRDFLIGVVNGLWLSALITTLVYLVAQNWAGF
jgi:hypothetical protein